MKYLICQTLTGVLTLVILTSCNIKKSEEQINVFCAASLTQVINDIKTNWGKGHQQNIVVNFASSGTLARQIEYGAEADIYLSANQGWMKYVVDIKKPHNPPRTIAKNKLVVIAPLESKIDSMNYQSILALLKSGNSKISIGDPGHVPLGRYTKSALETAGIYDGLISRIILAKDARNAMRLVELEEASWGIVYFTDAISSSSVKMIAEIPSDNHDEIIYEAVLFDSQNEDANSFYQFLISEHVRKIWLQYGFIQ
jgi:molybdate transport system substrate-binding protein